MSSSAPPSSSSTAPAAAPASEPRPDAAADDAASDSGASSFDEADDQDWADWVDDDGEAQGQGGNLTYTGADDAPRGESFKVPTRGLFPDKEGKYASFDSPVLALRQAREDEGCDLVAIVKRLNLDAIQVIRLLNHIRRSGSSGAALTPAQINALTGSEAFLNDDVELAPVAGLEDDGLLQLDFDELESGGSGGGSGDRADRVEELESELTAMRMAFQDLQRQYLSRMGLTGGGEGKGEEKPAPSSSSSGSKGASEDPSPSSVLPRPDSDSNYFGSYASNDIHQTMIEDSVRTLSYAKFLLSPRNAALIRGKTVMDVGCGSGILSLFCARAGAKKVLAIDASDVAHRARANVAASGWDHVVEVKQGKIEELGGELRAYEGQVDLIVSEWMGYFLLYECMLPSVLVARDRYLRPGTGLLAPSHCRMLLSAVSDAALLHERLHFWSDVYGFAMPSMAKGLEAECYTETLSQDKVVAAPQPIFDLPLQSMRAQQPAFVAPFALAVTRDATIHGFLSWFDTWFVPLPHPELPGAQAHAHNESQAPFPGECLGGQIIPGLPECTHVPITEADVEGVRPPRPSSSSSSSTSSPSPRARARAPWTQRAPTASELAAGPETVSFTTGPAGKETHWKQSVFLLKEGIEARAGQVIAGRIHVAPSGAAAGAGAPAAGRGAWGTSRELDVEIHWSVRASMEEHLAREGGGSGGGGGGGGAGQRKKVVEARCVQLWNVR